MNKKSSSSPTFTFLWENRDRNWRKVSCFCLDLRRSRSGLQAPYHKVRLLAKMNQVYQGAQLARPRPLALLPFNQQGINRSLVSFCYDFCYSQIGFIGWMCELPFDLVLLLLLELEFTYVYGCSLVYVARPRWNGLSASLQSNEASYSSFLLVCCCSEPYLYWFFYLQFELTQLLLLYIYVFPVCSL